MSKFSSFVQSSLKSNFLSGEPDLGLFEMSRYSLISFANGLLSLLKISSSKICPFGDILVCFAGLAAASKKSKKSSYIFGFGFRN